MLGKRVKVDQTLTTLLSQFKHREVRDLAWVIASPPLVSGTFFHDSPKETYWWDHESCLNEFQDCFGQLKDLDLQPSPLINHLSNLKNRRLGSIFEGLVSFWLNISPNYRELEQNIQIIEDKHTYGEIDFIIEDLNSKEIIHLEVAVKFYLGCEPYKDAYRWFGTNTKDQLGKKIDHLKDQQTQLSQKYPEQLKTYFSKPIDRKHCFVKGRLFYPENSDNPPTNIGLSNKHLRGRWCYAKDHDVSKKVVKIKKSHWLADLNDHDITNLGYASKEAISKIDRAECFVDVENIGESVMEKERIFYLPKEFTFPK